MPGLDIVTLDASAADGTVTVQVTVTTGTGVPASVGVHVYDRAFDNKGVPARELRCAATLVPGGTLTITYPALNKGKKGERHANIVAWDKAHPPQTKDQVD
jgi:hypothetical protein